MTTPSIKLLALDDDELVLDLLARGLAHDGFEVETVSSTAAARAALGRSAAAAASAAATSSSSSSPDFVLVDVNIPGMTRDDVAGLIKEQTSRCARTRFVLFSSEDVSKLRSLASEIGAHGWLSKSTPLDGIARELRKMLLLTTSSSSSSSSAPRPRDPCL